MKTIDRDFTVRIDGKVFTGNEIYKIEIDGTRFNLDCGCKSGTDFKISGNTKNLEFLGNIPTARELEGYEMCGDRGFYGPPHGNPTDDIEIVSPLGTMKKALDEAIKEIDKTPGEIHVGIDLDGKQFAKAIKPGDSIRNSRSEPMIAAFDKVGAATKELNERFNTLRNSIEALNRVATEALKKYDNTGGD